MTENKNTQTEILKVNIEDKKQETLDEIDSTLSDIDLDISSKERGQAMVSDLSKISKDEVYQEAKAILERQNSEITAVQRAELMEDYNEKMATLIKRLAIVVEVGGEDFESLNNTLGLFRLTEKDEAEKVSPEWLEMLRKLRGNKSLEPNELSQLRIELKVLSTLGQVDPHEAASESHKYVGFVILSELNSEQRMQVIEGMKGDELYHKLLIKLVATNYITVSDGISLLNLATNVSEENKAAALGQIDSDGMRLYQSNLKKIQDSAAEIYERNYSQNYAGKYLNPQTYLIGKVGQIWGIGTMAGNFLYNVDISHLWKREFKEFFGEVAGLGTNVAFLGGAAVTGAVAEHMSGGFGKGAISTFLNRLTKDKSLDEDAKIELKNKNMADLFNNNPAFAEFYYRNAEQIQKLRSLNQEITIESVCGKNYDSLSASEKRTSKEFFENNLAITYAAFADDEIGLSLTKAELQKRFIEEQAPKAFAQFKDNLPAKT